MIFEKVPINILVTVLLNMSESIFIYEQVVKENSGNTNTRCPWAHGWFHLGRHHRNQ